MSIWKLVKISLFSLGLINTSFLSVKAISNNQNLLCKYPKILLTQSESEPTQLNLISELILERFEHNYVYFKILVQYIMGRTRHKGPK